MGRISICLLLAVLFWCGTLLADRQLLNRELVRLHVVANSDSPRDQATKLRIRDAVTESLQKDLEKIADVEEAKVYLLEKLPYIQQVAMDTLKKLGCEDCVSISLCREAFDTRFYDTFSLPAGVYEALRIVIGEGNGQNWWCVVFPQLCIPAASEGAEAVASGAGFPRGLNKTLTGEEPELRFALLDMMGRLEGFFFEG